MSDRVLWRGVVRHWQRGQAGHINIQHYAQIADDCSRALGHELGLDAQHARSAGTVVRCASEQFRFLVELVPGTAVFATGGVEEIIDGWIVHHGTVRRVLDDRTVCLFRRRIRPFRADAGGFADWAAPALEQAARLEIEPPDGPGPIVGPTSAVGGTETYRGTVEPHECNEFDLLLARGLWDKLTRALWATQAAIGADRTTFRTLGLAGGAAVFDLTHHSQISLGTPLVIRTSVMEVRDKSLRMEHRVLNAQSEAVLVGARYVLAFVDRSSGERAAIPTEIRRRAEALRADHPRLTTENGRQHHLG